MKTLHLSITVMMISTLLIVIGLFLTASNFFQAFQTLSGCPPMPMGASSAFCQNWTAVKAFASGVIIAIVGVTLIVIARKKGRFQTQ